MTLNLFQWYDGFRLPSCLQPGQMVASFSGWTWGPIVPTQEQLCSTCLNYEISMWVTTWAFLIMNFYLLLACRAGDYKMPLVCVCRGARLCACVHECLAVFSKVEGCGVLCLNDISSVSHALHFCCFCRFNSIAKWAMGLVATLSKLLITPKPLHLEDFAICSNIFSAPTRWYLF